MINFSIFLISIHILITNTYIGKQQNQESPNFNLFIFQGPYYVVSTYLGQSIFHSWPLTNVNTPLLRFTDKQAHTT